MATTVYKSDVIELIDGRLLYITPLKIKYLRQFMKDFEDIKNATDDMDAIYRLSKCVAVTMQQYCPELASIEAVEDNMDLSMMYSLLELSTDIKMTTKSEDVKETIEASEGSTWENFDIAKLEAELFLLGIWKDYEDLETSLSLPEMMATLAAKRELSHHEKKFLAAIQGIDLDGENSSSQEVDPWERIKARAAARARGEDPDNAIVDPNDIVSFSGAKAQQAGFGIGMGLDYIKM